MKGIILQFLQEIMSVKIIREKSSVIYKQHFPKSLRRSPCKIEFFSLTNF